MYCRDWCFSPIMTRGNSEKYPSASNEQSNLAKFLLNTLYIR